MDIVAIILATVLAVYCVLMFLPIVYPDCPYRTPLSSPKLSVFLRHAKFPSPAKFRDRISDSRTMVEIMTYSATAPSEERTIRDERALIWTVKSLADDVELAPLVESIPDVRCAAGGPYRGSAWEL
jgi:hypothetical protein